MNWDAIGAISEFLGAAGVIATLIYLAAQIRQSSRVELAKSEREIMDSWNQVMATWWGNPQVAEIAIRGLAGQKLSGGERGTFHGLLTQVLTHHGSALRMHQKGLIDVQTMKVFQSSVVNLLQSPGAADWWSSIGKAYFDNEYIDAMLANAEFEAHDWTRYFDSSESNHDAAV